MAIFTRQPLTTGFRVTLIILSLFLLQVNVPTPPSAHSVWVFADIELPQPRPVNIWLPAKTLLASARTNLSAIKSAFTPSTELVTRTFKIVKVESRRNNHNAGHFIWPVKGGISSAFGMRRHPVTKKNSFHNGIDIRARQGTNILCPTDGVVVSAGHAGLLGRLVKIKTTSGKTLYFGHMHKIKCIKGQKIKKGSLIGTVGSSGRATGPHLHFSVVNGGKYLNPLKYLAAD